jgi:hypothetical protein
MYLDKPLIYKKKQKIMGNRYFPLSLLEQLDSAEEGTSVSQHNIAGSAVVRHHEVAQEIPSDDCTMRLTCGREVRSNEIPVDQVLEGRDVNLSHMDVHHARPMHSANFDLIDDGKLELHCQRGVNTALRSAGIYECADILSARYW